MLKLSLILLESSVACVVGHHYYLDPEAQKMFVVFQQTGWHCLPWTLGSYAATDSARPHAVVG